MDQALNTVFEDDSLLVVNKPAGLVCHPTKGDEWSSLVGRVRVRFGAEHDVHLLNRLDRETSGLVLLAKGNENARQLRRLLEGGGVEKEYQAIVNGWPEADAGTIERAIGLDDASEVAIKRCVREDGKAARTDYVVVRRFERDGERYTWLKVLPHTGRTHQIRVHLAHDGHPIVGDKIYGGDERLFLAFTRRELTESQRTALRLPFQALHATALRFEWGGCERVFRAEPERWFADFLAGEPVKTKWEEAYV